MSSSDQPADEGASQPGAAAPAPQPLTSTPVQLSATVIITAAPPETTDDVQMPDVSKAPPEESDSQKPTLHQPPSEDSGAKNPQLSREAVNPGSPAAPIVIEPSESMEIHNALEKSKIAASELAAVVSNAPSSVLPVPNESDPTVLVEDIDITTREIAVVEPSDKVTPPVLAPATNTTKPAAAQSSSPTAARNTGPSDDALFPVNPAKAQRTDSANPIPSNLEGSEAQSLNRVQQDIVTLAAKKNAPQSSEASGITTNDTIVNREDSEMKDIEPSKEDDQPAKTNNTGLAGDLKNPSSSETPGNTMGEVETTGKNALGPDNDWIISFSNDHTAFQSQSDSNPKTGNSSDGKPFGENQPEPKSGTKVLGAQTDANSTAVEASGVISSGDASKGAGDAPKEASDAPKGASDVPNDVSAAPKDVSDAPKDGSDVSKDAGDALKDAGDAPKDVSDVSKDAGDSPKDTGDAPKDAGDSPKDTGDAPKDVSDVPKDASDVPKDAADAAICEGVQSEPKALPENPSDNIEPEKGDSNLDADGTQGEEIKESGTSNVDEMTKMDATDDVERAAVTVDLVEATVVEKESATAAPKDTDDGDVDMVDAEATVSPMKDIQKEVGSTSNEPVLEKPPTDDDIIAVDEVEIHVSNSKNKEALVATGTTIDVEPVNNETGKNIERQGSARTSARRISRSPAAARTTRSGRSLGNGAIRSSTPVKEIPSPAVKVGISKSGNAPARSTRASMAGASVAPGKVTQVESGSATKTRGSSAKASRITAADPPGNSTSVEARLRRELKAAEALIIGQSEQIEELTRALHEERINVADMTDAFRSDTNYSQQLSRLVRVFRELNVALPSLTGPDWNARSVAQAVRNSIKSQLADSAEWTPAAEQRAFDLLRILLGAKVIQPSDDGGNTIKLAMKNEELKREIAFWLFWNDTNVRYTRIHMDVPEIAAPEFASEVSIDFDVRQGPHFLFQLLSSLFHQS